MAKFSFTDEEKSVVAAELDDGQMVFLPATSSALTQLLAEHTKGEGAAPPRVKAFKASALNPGDTQLTPRQTRKALRLIAQAAKIPDADFDAIMAEAEKA